MSNGDIARNCCFVSATSRPSLFLSLSFSLSDVPKFFQLRIIIFPGMSRRCFPTPSSTSLISGKFFSRFPLENTAARARARVSPPHPFPGSSTQKNFNSAPEKSRMATLFLCSHADPVLQRTAIISQASWRIRFALLDNYCPKQNYSIRKNLLTRFRKGPCLTWTFLYIKRFNLIWWHRRKWHIK